MKQLIGDVRQDLKASIDEKTKQTFQRFFKEKITCYGVKTPTVDKIAKKYLKQIKQLSKQEVFDLCETLYKSDYTEEAFVANTWLPYFAGQFEENDLEIFRVWIEKYINNWAKCDGFCNHTVGDFIIKYPQCTGRIVSWAQSSNRWLKRASAVSFILLARKGYFLQEAFEVSDILLLDPDDMVQKGYGWLLKEESRQHTKEVYEYILKNRKVMPRTALRYAIELMPKELKIEAMKKD